MLPRRWQCLFPLHMKSTTKYILGALLIGSFSFATIPVAQAQKQPVKEAGKVNKKRGKAMAYNSPFSSNELQYDAEFAVAAASTNMLDVALGKLAQQKAIALEVKQWGKTVADHHTQQEKKLQSIAQHAYIKLPTTMSTDDRDHYDDVDDRKYLGFDKKFLRALKDSHERAIEHYEEASTKLRNSELRAFATSSLPLLREHLKQTEQLYERANERK